MLTLLFAMQAATVAPANWTPPNQLSCTIVGPVDQTPASFDLDLVGRKMANAAIVAATGAFARTSSTSVVLTPAGDPARLIGIATGNAQYRLRLTPAGEGARLQVFATADGNQGDLVMQGFCGVRGGKPLVARKLLTLPLVDQGQAAPPWTLQLLSQALPDRSCVLIGADRQPHTVGYTVTSAVGNELTVAYRADAPDLFGAAGASASGTRFYLVAPARRMVSVMVTVDGSNPPIYVHTSLERSGTWIDVTRDKRLVAVGSCGPALPMLVAPPAGTVSP